MPRKASGVDEIRESGNPGGGRGRTDEIGGRSGVQPVSLPHSPRPEAVIRGMAEWGQGQRGPAGYEDHGESEIVAMPPSAEAPHALAEQPRRGAEPHHEPASESGGQPAGALPSALLRTWRQPRG